jgi:hypothetical protein
VAETVPGAQAAKGLVGIHADDVLVGKEGANYSESATVVGFDFGVGREDFGVGETAEKTYDLVAIPLAV